MRIPGTPEGCERIPYVVVHQENAAFSDVYGGGGNIIGLDCHLVRPIDSPSKRVLVFMHPTGGGMYLPIISGLARAGHHVIWANSRYRGTDSALIMEKVAADLGMTIKDARDRLGYEQVVLMGWSGGGSLSMWYQSVAETGMGLSDTAAGDPYEALAANLPPADLLVMSAAHISRHGILTEWMDPSITDEAQPFQRTTEFNLYDPANPNQPSYAADYVAEFRRLQIERNRRITAWVREQLDVIRGSDQPNRELAFTVHGTMADPRWLDTTIEPNGRPAHWCYLGDPQLVNDGPVGLARFSTLRSWLSQWSYDDARADALTSAAGVHVPVMVLGAGSDDACTPSHTDRLYAAVAEDRRHLHIVHGAGHYFGGPDGRAHLNEAVQEVGRFIGQHLD